MMKHFTTLLVVGFTVTWAIPIGAEDYGTPLSNLYDRTRTDLSGQWRYIVDPLDQGHVTNKGTRYPFPLDIKREPGGTLVEFDWDQQDMMRVPGDWNSQVEALEFYAGLVWYRRAFDFFPEAGRRYFLYFEAADYHTTLFLNAEKVGEHEGGVYPILVRDHRKIEGRSKLVRGRGRQHPHAGDRPRGELRLVELRRHHRAGAHRRGARDLHPRLPTRLPGERRDQR
jgi:hypothetical protein